jgi:hypothetical protein
MKPRDQNPPGTPRIRSVGASEAQEVFREFVQKLARLDRPLAKLPHSERRRANGHLRGNGARRANAARPRRRP